MNSTSYKKKDFKYHVGDKFIDENRDLEIVDRYEKIRIKSESSKEYQKIYVCKCNRCGANDAIIEQCHLKSGRGCPVCHSKQVSIGVNDIPTTAPWMVDYFQDGYEEAKQYTNQSSVKLYFKCPYCGEIKHNKISINHLYRSNGLNCVCRDGFSFPEKFMYSLLSQLGINFTTQFIDDWCKPYRYDFYLNDYKCIIETHGYQHYKLCKFNDNNVNNLKYQQEIDTYKRKLALKNGISNYLEIDCCHSDYKYIKNSILRSGLFNILPCANISWDECNKFAISNLLKNVCTYYENDKKESLVNITDKFGIDSCTVTRYLKIGSELGYCAYDPKQANIMKSKSIKIFTQNGSFDIYESAKELEKMSLNKYGVKLLKDGIQLVCRKKKDIYKGFYFEYV